MMDIHALYQEKRTTPQEAVDRFLFSGAVCASDIALAEAPVLYEAIGEAVAAGKLTDITHHSLLETEQFPCFRPELQGKYTGVSWYSSTYARNAIWTGAADMMPAYYQGDERK